MKKKSSHWKQLGHLRALERKRRRIAARRARRVRRTRLNAMKDVSLLAEHRVHAPATIALEGHNHDSTVDFLSKLRSAFAASDKVVCVDFRATSLMVSAGTLLFYSELQRLRYMYPEVPVRCFPSKDGTVNQVLEHLGIFKVLGFDSGVVPSRPDVVSWRKASSSDIDGDKVGELLLKYKSLTSKASSSLFRGAGEAMFNVRHAYLESRRDGLPDVDLKKWWMFCRESEETMLVAVCDLGIGIPRSLPLKYPEEHISALLSKFRGGAHSNDAKMIRAAMEIERSSTNLKGRGKGLKDFLKVVESTLGSRLYIFSNKGLVTYDGSDLKTETFLRSIRGTLVIWVVPINRVSVNE